MRKIVRYMFIVQKLIMVTKYLPWPKALYCGFSRLSVFIRVNPCPTYIFFGRGLTRMNTDTTVRVSCAENNSKQLTFFAKCRFIPGRRPRINAFIRVHPRQSVSHYLFRPKANPPRPYPCNPCPSFDVRCWTFDVRRSVALPLFPASALRHFRFSAFPPFPYRP
jgi:hypothetical protein